MRRSHRVEVALRLPAAQGTEPNVAQSGCRACKGNTASNGIKCETCVRKIATADKKRCVECGQGKYFHDVIDQHACKHCPPGKQINETAMATAMQGSQKTSFNNSNKPCEACPVGKVGTLEDRGVCSDCPPVRVAQCCCFKLYCLVRACC